MPEKTPSTANSECCGGTGLATYAVVPCPDLRCPTRSRHGITLYQVSGASIDVQDGAPIRIWLVPGSKDRNIQRHFVFEMVGGPKRYLNVWFAFNEEMGGESTDWSWVVHPSAIVIWELADAERTD